MRNYTVVLEWSDRRDGEADADEIWVSAASEHEAIAEGKKRWRLTIGAEWPSCRLTRAWVLNKEQAARLL